MTQQYTTHTPLFPLGKVVITPGAISGLKQLKLSPYDLLLRHQSGDWGDMVKQDYQTNLEALLFGRRLMSAYQLEQNIKIWIVTESNRIMTTILLPEEY